MVVMPDADLDQVVDGLIGAGYGSAGERCMALSVAVAVGDVGDKLIEKLTPRVQNLKVGPGTDPEVEMGPLISDVHLAKVKSYVDEGVSEGAELIVDGRSISLQGYENGYFIGGCLFARAFSNQCKIGMVGVNVPIPVPMAFHSFGGWKRSLFGDHAMHGMDGVRFFTRLKTVTSRWPTGMREGAEFTIPTMK